MTFRSPPFVLTHSLVIAWISGLGLTLSIAEPDAQKVAFFENKVRPLLSEHCYDCHSQKAEKIKGGLLLDTKEGWSAGGDSGDVIDPGNPTGSLLMETVQHSDPDMQMPPKYKLEDAEIEVLEKWIAMGAPDPRIGGGVVKSSKPKIDIEEGRKHWAFQVPRNPELPSVKDSSWGKDSLDRFILAGIEKAGIHPSPDADRYTLIRRATLDLIGLPPTVTEVNAFVKDTASDDEAFAKVVDRLLQSENFGERWGRHWLDIARYADSVGRTRNIPFPYAWRFRNYVIDSLNRDKPYHVFVGEQIAGDLMPAKNPVHRDEMLVATGYLALGSMDLNERDREQFMLDRVDDQVDTLGRSVLGLTTGCARCHDHKFDPVSQKDYYALAGIFSSTETLSGQLNKGGGGAYTRTTLLASLGKSGASPGSAKNDGGPRKPVLDTSAIQVAQKRLRFLNTQSKATDLKPKKKKEIQSQLKRTRTRLAQLQKGMVTPAKKKGGKKKKGSGEVNPEALFAMGAKEGKPADLALRVRGEPDIKGDVVSRGFPAVLCAEGVPEIPEGESGRLDLARWLASPEHPLTSRVMVNRIWDHLFGRGIVPTVDNFGVAGEKPTHPELLDHLTTRFVTDGWSIKKMIRTMMLSRSYRMSSDQITANSEVDESNRLFWRMNLRRMEAEVIRDSLLAAGGTLDTKRPTGSPFEGSKPAQLGKGGPLDQTEKIFQNGVRSIYLPVFRSKISGMFTVFDFAEPSMVNGQRDVTTVAPQALFLMNNNFVVKASTQAAERVQGMNLPDKDARIRYAYAYTLCRKPSEAELSRSKEFLSKGNNWPAFMQALYSTAEFRYIR